VLRDWSEYFFLIGSAAGGLIGLLFVIVTLTAGRERSALERGQKLYMTPIVFHLGGVLLLSGMAIAPPTTPEALALTSGVIALIGLVSGTRIATGISRLPPTTSGGWFDVWWYGIIPAAIYVVLLTAAGGMWLLRGWAVAVMAGALMALLLTSMHLAWDLVTYLAPRRNEPLPLEKSEAGQDHRA
jgi:hypothetical protein